MKKYFPFLILSLILSPGALEAMKGKKPSSSEEVENKKHVYRHGASNLTFEDIERKYTGRGLTSERKNSEDEIKEQPTEEQGSSKSSSSSEDNTRTAIDMDALEEQNEGENLNFMVEKKRKDEELAQLSNERQELHEELNVLTYEEKNKEEKEKLFKYFLALETLIKARKVREIEHSEERRQKGLQAARVLYAEAKKEYEEMKKEENEKKK